ncbi:MAG: hypothetical protein U5K51_13455 [Flavobacteriaceae bacterium]|nr:hypothetical protein [Flavobacteriaceae bacterium]
MKFSYNATAYPEIYPDKLGSNSLEQVFKDYNGQTYWFSVNLWSFFKESKIPRWLNISLGYGAEGLPEYEPGINSKYCLSIPTILHEFGSGSDKDINKIILLKNNI